MGISVTWFLALIPSRNFMKCFVWHFIRVNITVVCADYVLLQHLSRRMLQGDKYMKVFLSIFVELLIIKFSYHPEAYIPFPSM